MSDEVAEEHQPSRVERRAAERREIDQRPLRGGVGPMLMALSRMAIGFVFLWAFLDKLFGLGKPTPRAKSWLNGGSPTTDYLSNAGGPAKEFFHDLAGKEWTDWLFMIGLAGIGIAFMVGIGTRIAAVAGTLLLFMIWLTALPIATNPFVDEHVVYAITMLGIAVTGIGMRYSLAPWRRTRLVTTMPWLK